MAHLGNEVSQKIRCAIKAKLTELGTYVDDELPDYIMVLVANKKSKDQMDDDLRLFLGTNTERFTTWLHSVLQKLNAASVIPTVEQKVPETIVEVVRKVEAPKVQSKVEVVITPSKELKSSSDKEEKHKKNRHEDKKKKKDKKEKKKKKRKKDEKVRSAEKVEKKTSPREKLPKSEPLQVIADRKISSRLSVNPIFITIKGSVSDSESKPQEKPLKSIVEKPQVKNDVKAEGPLLLEEGERSDESEDAKSEEPVVIVEQPTVPEAPTRTVLPPPKEEGVKRKRLELGHELEDPSLSEDEEEDEAPRPKRRPHDDSLSGLRSSLRKRLDSPREAQKPSSDSKRKIINLREESTFPPRSSSKVLSSTMSTTGTRKKLEARVRPLVSSRIAVEKCEEENEDDYVDEEETQPRVKSAIVSVIAPRQASRASGEESSEEEEITTIYPKKSVKTGVASKIEVMPRPKRTMAGQPNKSLILRAMADANKSVTVTKGSKRAHDDTSDVDEGDLRKKLTAKRKQLYTRGYKEREKRKLTAAAMDLEARPRKMIAITLANDKRAGDGEEGEQRGAAEEDYMAEDEAAEEGEPIPRIQTVRTVPPVHSRNDESTRFVVTLTESDEPLPHSNAKQHVGSRLRRPTNLDEEDYIEEVEEWEEEELMEEEVPENNYASDGQTAAVSAVGAKNKAKTITPAPQVKGVPKMEMRCRYWPVCKEGQKCPFFHPSKSCNTFPNCRYGDKCLYIHPNCKFDAACTKLDCPYTHASGRHLALAAAAGSKAKLVPTPIPPATLSLAKIRCRFFPKCTNVTCPYLHPKQCRFGAACQTPGCYFVHPEVATGAKLKWSAPKPVASSTTAAAPTTVTSAPAVISAEIPAAETADPAKCLSSIESLSELELSAAQPDSSIVTAETVVAMT